MKNRSSPAEVAVDDEVTILVARLVETQLRLEELVGAHADAVLLPDGQSYLLREAQEKLRRREAEMLESAAVQSAILDALPAHIALIDNDGAIISVNEAWRTFAGSGGMRDPEAVEGANYLQICQRAGEAGSPGALDGLAGIRSVLAGTTDLFALVYPCASSAGDHWFRMRVSPVNAHGYRGAVILHVDITESESTEIALREREAEFRTLIETVPQIVWMTRPDGWNIYFSGNWMEYTGLTLEESLGQGWITPFHPDDRAGARDAWFTATRTLTPYTVEARLRRFDGAYRWWLMRAVPHPDESGVIKKWFGTCTDIDDIKLTTEALRVALDETERRVAARTEELANANRKLTGALELAEAANLAKSQFLSRMSHELRTPMNAVLGYAQLLQRRYRDAEIKEFAGAILSGGKHLLRLIDELLDIGRVESGELSLSLERVDVNEVLNHALAMVQPNISASDIRITIRFESCRGLQVEADRSRLAQVLINLLSNAVKYNRSGGEVLVVCVLAADGFCRIEISDTGHGISSSDRLRLFQPFQRFGDLGIPGTGLGLALSWRLMNLMGGRLGLAESSDRGSTFFLELKRTEAAPIASVATTQSVPIGPKVGLQGKVLCIEDNPPNLRLIEIILASWTGVSLITADNGTTGLQLARTRAVDVILLDLHLPDISGRSVLTQLKQDPKTTKIPVVILSADATREQTKALLDEGAAAYITKPLDLAQFSEVLHQFLASTQGPPL